MNTGVLLTFRIIALLCLGVMGFHRLTLWSAPGHGEAAVFVGLLLTSFGVAAAAFAMKLLVLPIAVLRMFVRLFQGHEPRLFSARERDPLDLLGRVVFVVGFMALSALVGAGAGFAAGGHGVIASAAAFAAFGALLAILVPAEVVFESEESTGGTTTAGQRADHEAEHRDGVPVTEFADRVAKRLREQWLEDQRKP